MGTAIHKPSWTTGRMATKPRRFKLPVLRPAMNWNPPFLRSSPQAPTPQLSGAIPTAPASEWWRLITFPNRHLLFLLLVLLMIFPEGLGAGSRARHGTS